jgi:hypothetical protein
VVNVSQPIRPQAAWQLEQGYARRIHLDGGRIYVADQELGLLILDDPVND